MVIVKESLYISYTLGMGGEALPRCIAKMCFCNSCCHSMQVLAGNIVATRVLIEAVSSVRFVVKEKISHAFSVYIIMHLVK